MPFSVLSLHDASRYLRARKFVPQDAFAQFKDTEKWRKDNNLDALYEKIEIQDYQEARSVVCRSEDKTLISLLIFASTRNGLAAEITAAYPSISTRSESWIRKK